MTWAVWGFALIGFIVVLAVICVVAWWLAGAILYASCYAYFYHITHIAGAKRAGGLPLRVVVRRLCTVFWWALSEYVTDGPATRIRNTYGEWKPMFGFHLYEDVLREEPRQ